MTLFVQQNYEQYPEHGYPGLVARPEEPCTVELGILGTSSISRAAAPGAGLFWDRANEVWRIPQSGAEDRTVTGLLSYDQSKVQKDEVVEIAVGDEIQVGIMGVFWATAGEALKRGDRVIFNASAGNWNRTDSYAPDTVTVDAGGVASAIQGLVNGTREGGIAGSLTVCASKSADAGDLFMMRMSYGIGTPIVY